MQKPERQEEGIPTSPLDEAITRRHLSTVGIVKAALENRQVLMAYQPVMQSRAQHNIAFYESLLRVVDPTGRIVPARDFIHQIEETEYGRIMDCISLENVLRTLTRHPGLRLSVNMSARSIGFPRWISTLNKGLKRDVTVGERLILEVSEQSAMKVPELVIDFMKKYHARGVSFAIDDFGAGRTSFRHLRDFQFDMVKIDGGFIRGISQDADNQVLVAALASVAGQFNMVTVAASVETAPDAEFLTKLGIDCLQGYFFAAPTIKPYWLQKSAKRA